MSHHVRVKTSPGRSEATAFPGEPVRTQRHEEERSPVDHDTGLFAHMLWLHALATAGRHVNRPQPPLSHHVAFVLEQPQEVERRIVVMRWSNPMWLSYAAGAGLFRVDFEQGPLGHAIGTNLSHLRELHGFRSPEPKPSWTGEPNELAARGPGLVEATARALQRLPRRGTECTASHLKIGSATLATTTFHTDAAVLCVSTAREPISNMPELRTRMCPA